MVLCSRVSALLCHLTSGNAWWMKYMSATWAFRGASGEPKKPSTGQASTSKSQNSSQGAAFATATNQSRRKKIWNVTKYLNDHGRASQQTYSSSMVPSTWLQLTAVLISSTWIYWRLRQLERLLPSWNLIWQDMVFQTDSPQTTAQNSTVLSFRSLPPSTSLNTLKCLHGILSPTGRLRTASKQRRISWKKAADASHDPHLSLLDFWNTPSEGMDSNPAQRLFSCRARTSLPTAGHLLQPKVIPNVYQNFQQRQNKQALSFNRGAKELQRLKDGDVVQVRPLPGHSRWFKAQVSSQEAPRSAQSAQKMTESIAETVHIFTKFLWTFKRYQTKT